MRFETFQMERMQSVWENRVRYNLSESGVQPLTLGELIDPGALGDTLLGYPQTNGSDELRELVSDLYPGSDGVNVVVTSGTAEANFLSVLNLVEPGDEAVVMFPNYMQIGGLARSLGANVKPLLLREEEGWRPDLDDLARAVTDKTRLIALCNPNNPTGAVVSDDDMRAICKVAGKVGAWILSDEVYQGAELGGEPASTLWGWYDRLLVTCGLSKAYGLPGLRIGWIVGPPDRIEALWSYKDYTTIAPSALSEKLARVALEPQSRHKILERTRRIVKSQWPLLSQWVEQYPDLFAVVPPRAGAIAYLHCRSRDVSSLALMQRLRDEKSVLVVPAEHFGMEHHVRIGFGYDPEILKDGLKLFSELMETIRSEVGAKQ
jgi:aspartate/methionine/tyrosine aminotransferase